MRFTVPDGIHHREVDDEAVILDSTGDRYFGLNPTGALLWDRLAEGAALSDAVASVVAEFEVDPDTARDDAAALTDRLIAAGLLKPRD